MRPSRWGGLALRTAAVLLLVLGGCAHDGGPFLTPDAPAESRGQDAGATAQPPGPAAQAPPGEKAASPPSGTPSAGRPPDAAVGPAPPASGGVCGSQPAIWGIVGLRAYPYGEHVASNGQEFDQLFSLDLDFNVWLWRQQGLYLFADSRFWGQKAAPGVTNPNQGTFDFSKREFDLNGGVAWNYYGFLEARAFAYSFNNLNRGNSAVSPSGFQDGVGLENRYYINRTYADLGGPEFDPARASFVGLGFYPSKTMVDDNGREFKPGPFARLYLTWDLFGPKCYLFTDDQLIATQGFQFKLLSVDSGLAVRPFDGVPHLEFRVGSEDAFDLQGTDMETSVYLSARYIF